jgi:hypothetical protein
MALKNKTHEIDKAATVQRAPQQAALNSNEHEHSLNPVAALQRATGSHSSALRPADILTLQRTIGNRAVQRMLSNQAHSLSPQTATPANAIQRQTEEEEPLQGKFETAPRTENRTGLPDELKAGIENLSSMAMDDVRVHYNSSKPAQVEALAYTQGTEIHVAPGQEQHLPHEAWHVVQQEQGRVKPTLQMKGVEINDDARLEREADVMGARAATMTAVGSKLDIQRAPLMKTESKATDDDPIQRKVGFEFETSWAIEKPSDVDWGTNSKLVTGTGWQLSPDELKGDSAVIEFKTEPFENEGENTAELTKTIKASFTNLKTYGDKLVGLTKKGAIPDAKDKFKGVQVTPKNDKLAAKPQVTGGVREDLILNFLADTTKEKAKTSGADLMPGEGRKGPMKAAGKIAAGKIDEESAKDKKYAGTVTLLAFYLRRAYQRHEEVMQEVRAWSKEYIKTMNASDPTKKEEMRANYNAAKMEEMKKRAPSYAKGIASVLPRVRFSKLPEISRQTLLKDVVDTAGMEEYEKGRQAWPTGLKSFDDVWGSADITIENWIKSIQAEKPSLSLAKAQFWGEREIEAGEVGVGEKKGAGILLELRGQEGGLTYDKYFEYAVPFLKYFRELNEKNKPAKA